MNQLLKLSETLNELMTLQGLTEQTLSENSKIPISCISLYVRGLQAPYIDTLIKLADYFNCSTDYLLGRTDNFAIANNFETNASFTQRFNELLEKNKCTYKSFDTKKIAKSSFYEWKRGDSLPTLENLITLVDFFGCSLDFILGREN